MNPPLGPSSVRPAARGSARLRAEAQDRVVSVTTAAVIVSVAAAGVLAVALHPSTASASTTTTSGQQDQRQGQGFGPQGFAPGGSDGQQPVGGSGGS